MVDIVQTFCDSGLPGRRVKGTDLVLLIRLREDESFTGQFLVQGLRFRIRVMGTTRIQGYD